MKEYLLLFRGGDGRMLQQSPDEWQAHMSRWMEWMGGLQKEETLLGGQPLVPEGKQVQGTNKVVTDGPFTEGKEYVGGYLLIKAADVESATEIAKSCPILEFDTGNVEVRAIHDMKM